MFTGLLSIEAGSWEDDGESPLTPGKGSSVSLTADC